MRKFIALTSFVGCILAILWGTIAISAEPNHIQEHWQQKVDPLVLAQAAEGETEALIFLEEQADLSPAFQLKTKQEKGAFVYQTLRETALRTQKPVLAFLERRNIPHRAFWVANMIWVKADYPTIAALASREEIAKIFPNPKIKLEVPPSTYETLAPSDSSAVEWNIQKIRAPEVWAAGFTGQGVVIGGQDTGVDWEHPALINQYRGWNGSTASHDYNWHDAIHNSGGVDCEDDSTEPCDDYKHGTHTMGIAVGDEFNTHKIGVAPGSRWIACRNMDHKGVGSPATYTECYEWFIAPYPIGGDPFTDGDPSKAPDIINNSWSCPEDEGCNADSLREVVQAVYAAGILTVHSAGNDGPGCSTINTPAAIYPESFTVGATDRDDLIANFGSKSSSRGPVTIDSSNLMKPNISAPGVSIYSCTPNSNGETLNGTSMASPHVAGLAALLISADHSLAGQVDKIRQIIEKSAVPLYTPDGCGGDTNTSLPNNTFGWGRIDAWNALQNMEHHITITKTAQPAIVAPNQLITYTLTISHYHPLSITRNVIVTDVIPTNTDFISATLPFSKNGNKIMWKLGDLASTQTSTLQLIVKVDANAQGMITNSMYAVKSDEVETNFGEAITTTIQPYDLTIEKAAPTKAAPGDTIFYTITVKNPHPSAPTHQITISDTIPTNTVFIDATKPFTFENNIVSWYKDVLASQESSFFTFTTKLPLTQTIGIVTNSEYGAKSREVPFVKGAPTHTEIHALDIYKSTTPAIAIYNQPLTYSLTVTNNMSFNALHHLVLTDSIPSSVTFISATLPYTYENHVISWFKESLEPKGQWEVQFTVMVTTHQKIINEDYSVVTDEVPQIFGDRVTTFVHTPAFKLSPTLKVNLAKGTSISYTHILTNTGNFTDQFQIDLSSSKGWLTNPTSYSITLPPGGAHPIDVIVTSPQDSALGDSDRIYIGVYSLADSRVSDAIMDVVTVQVLRFFPFISVH